MAKLTLRFEKTTLKEFTLTKGVVSIGRLPDNDIQVDNPAVSGHHAMIYWDEDHFVVEDNNSLNGTFIHSERVVKRRLKDAGLPERLSPHSFRVAAVTDLLTQGVPLEDVQYLAGHSEPRTTALYDRRQKKVTRNIVERISI